MRGNDAGRARASLAHAAPASRSFYLCVVFLFSLFSPSVFYLCPHCGCATSSAAMAVAEQSRAEHGTDSAEVHTPRKGKNGIDEEREVQSRDQQRAITVHCSDTLRRLPQ